MSSKATGVTSYRVGNTDPNSAAEFLQNGTITITDTGSDQRCELAWGSSGTPLRVTSWDAIKITGTFSLPEGGDSRVRRATILRGVSGTKLVGCITYAEASADTDPGVWEAEEEGGGGDDEQEPEDRKPRRP